MKLIGRINQIVDLTYQLSNKNKRIKKVPKQNLSFKKL